MCAPVKLSVFCCVDLCPPSKFIRKGYIVLYISKKAQKLQKTIPSIKEMYCTIPVADKLKIQIKPLLQMQMEHYYPRFERVVGVESSRLYVGAVSMNYGLSRVIISGTIIGKLKKPMSRAID
jgi:hypothetical protein